MSALATFAALGATTARAPGVPLVVHFVRHGQATHNVRAELRREEGCSHGEFIAQMQADDEFDADLTEMGRQQARAAAAGTAKLSIELVVVSPLSRAIETALLIFGDAQSSVPFVSSELLREWNGLLLNAKRRRRPELAARFPRVDFAGIPESDESWTEVLEPADEVAERGVRFLEWLAQRPEREIAVVAHGGIYAQLFSHARVHDDSAFLRRRFGNCEVRSAELSVRASEKGKGGAEFMFGKCPAPATRLPAS
ncbi:hypothetical protein KFE25_010070 [Diacronema lutheri]|uniref:Phosphoglycerate mutase n=1 Tax=Diacronema lutheri TaxID=2081491 RepID=A0A8J5XMU0_DIALT|nr:hypothetical protein KFE25_010070 [Diacronema lutheri]|mmetsp:Transcript_8311/g.26319  ORF Transcript_8311/g.26319 Transcript_8311/m.26319 type:complete len:254 (-) Transcript_8311:70-831(-)